VRRNAIYFHGPADCALAGGERRGAFSVAEAGSAVSMRREVAFRVSERGASSPDEFP